MTTYYPTRADAEKTRQPPDRILYRQDKGYWIKKVESAFWGK